MIKVEKSKQYVVMKNEFALAKHKLNVHEAKAIRMALACIDDRNDTEFCELKFDLKDMDEMMDADEANVSREFKGIGKKLAEQTVDVRIGEGDDDWLYIPMFKKIMYKNGILSIWFNEELEPYLLDVKTNFLKYDHELANIFTSIYSLRIYEALKSMYGEKKGLENEFEIPLKRLREITDTENKYEVFSGFRKKVLDIAMREISLHSDFIISYKPVKFGRQFGSVVFRMDKKQNKVVSSIADFNQEVQSEVSDTDFIVTLIGLLSVTEKCSFSQAEKVYLHYEKNKDHLLENIMAGRKKAGIKNFVGYIWDAKDREIKDILPKKKSSNKNKKNDYGYPISDSREQAYVDMQVDFVGNLWPDIEVIEEC